MNALLRIVANLMRPDAAGPAELGYQPWSWCRACCPNSTRAESSAA